jgi:uncharacterized protein DUF4129
MEWSRARVAGGALLAVLGVVLLLAVVALASRPGAGTGAPQLSADPARLVIDVTFYLLVVLLVLVLVVVVWALWPRPDDEPLALPPRRRWALSTILTALLFIGIALWLRGGGHLARPAVLGGGGFSGRPSALAPPARAAAGQAGFDWVAAAIVAVLLAAATALISWLLLRQRGGSRGQRALARLQAVLDDAIEDVLGEADPRRAVIAAWTRLERVLSRHGVPRHESEAPFEYAARAGAAIGVDPFSLERLADLFEWARFSLHDVTPAMRQEALDGLLAVRDGLRLAA